MTHALYLTKELPFTYDVVGFTNLSFDNCAEITNLSCVPHPYLYRNSKDIVNDRIKFELTKLTTECELELRKCLECDTSWSFMMREGDNCMYFTALALKSKINYPLLTLDYEVALSSALYEKRIPKLMSKRVRDW